MSHAGIAPLQHLGEAILALPFFNSYCTPYMIISRLRCRISEHAGPCKFRWKNPPLCRTLFSEHFLDRPLGTQGTGTEIRVD